MLGISKRSCLLCSAFLTTLLQDHDQKFFVRGSHGTITACSLPTWTPSHIVDIMNQNFGLVLRQDLLTLMQLEENASQRFRVRRKSTGSETLSLDSLEGNGGGFVPQSLRDNVRERT